MNRLYSGLFLFLYVAAILAPLYPVLDYMLHKEQIASVYCENKNKPAMHCNGKCHLMKQIKKAAERSPVGHSGTLNIEQFMPHDTPVQTTLVSLPLNLLGSVTFAWQEPVCSSQPVAVFHPPCC
jgi:hypothetical protein